MGSEGGGGLMKKVEGKESADAGEMTTTGKKDSNATTRTSSITGTAVARIEDEKINQKIHDKVKSDLERLQERQKSLMGSAGGGSTMMMRKGHGRSATTGGIGIQSDGFGTGNILLSSDGPGGSGTGTGSLLLTPTKKRMINLGIGLGSTTTNPSSPSGSLTAAANVVTSSPGTPKRDRTKSIRQERERQRSERQKDWRKEDREMFDRFTEVFEQVFGVKIVGGLEE